MKIGPWRVKYFPNYMMSAKTKPSFNAWKTVNNVRTTTTGIPTNTTPLPKDYPLNTCCHLRWWHIGDKKPQKTHTAPSSMTSLTTSE